MFLNEELIENNVGEVKYLSFKLLNELNVINAFSLKGLNFRNRDDIHIDYKKLLKCLGIEYKQLVKPLQKHTDNILIIDKKEKLDSADINLKYLEGVDAIITKAKNIAIATTSADCLCVVLYDIRKKVIANIHSGWRGTFQKISQKTLNKMIDEFKCDANDILAFLMPAIRQCHFEVDEDVMLECSRIFEYTGIIDEIIKLGRNIDGIQKYNIDNILLNKIMLEECGILKENIHDSRICSVCNSDNVHSRRADGEYFGLGTTVVMMK